MLDLAWRAQTRYQPGRYLRCATIALAFTMFAWIRLASAQTSIVLPDRSVGGPAVAAFNGSVVMAFTGTNSGRSINVESSSTGTSFGGLRLLVATPGGGAASSSFAPAIAANGNGIIVVWTDKADGKLHISRSPDGNNFSPSVTSIASSNAPAVALAGFQGTPLIVWVDPNHLLRNSDSAPPLVNEQVLGAPSLLVIGSTVYLAFTRASRTISIFSAPLDANGNLAGNFGPAFDLPMGGQTSFTGPGLGAFAIAPGAFELHVAWLDSSGQTRLSSFQPLNGGFVFEGEQAFPNSSGVNPAVLGLGARLLYYFTGTNSRQNLNVILVR